MKQDFRFHTIRTVLAVVLALFSAAVAGAQGRFTVTGKVSDASGKPMVGVTIIEQGTTNGTTTGLDGTYSLVVKDDRSVLQFSSLGYTSQSVTVGSKNEIDVSLSEDAINMSEVVVTGYGRTVTKDKLTAAISKVSSDVLEKGVPVERPDGAGRYGDRRTDCLDDRTAGCCPLDRHPRRCGAGRHRFAPLRDRRCAA